MAAHYQAKECEWLRDDRLAREPGIELVKCEDGIYRTPQEKAAYEEYVMAEVRRIS
jgi:hypothetical protein